MEEVVDLVLGRVIQEMNEQLTKQFHKEEIIQVVHNVYPTKTPNPDSLSAIFYKKYWDVIGDDGINTFLNVPNSNALVAALKQTHIALILKNKFTGPK